MQAWYLLYCKSRKEQAAKAALEQRGLTCFLPELTIDKIVKGKKQRVTQPLFPNYLFVRFDPHLVPYSNVIHTPNVASIVRTNGQLQAVDLGVVVMLREKLNQDQSVVVDLPQRGDRVLITDGPFKNIEAIFAEPDGNQRSVLLVKLLGEMQRLTVDNLGFHRLAMG